MIESHCHLDYLKQLPLDEIVSKSKEAGIDKIITISVDPDNLQTVIDIAKSHPDVYCTQGIHPHDAKLANDEQYEIIKNNTLNFKKVVAIGEIGLDYHYDNSPREIQRDAFTKQLNMAVELNKPVVIHTRDADDDTLSILVNIEKNLTRKGVLHSFTSGRELAEASLKMGFYIGFNGIITFKKADNVREIVEITPLEQMLIETDSPFLTPTPHRGKENAPFYLPFIVKKIAEIKGVSEEEVIESTTQNAKNLFNI